MNTIKIFCQPKFALVTLLLAILVAVLVTSQQNAMAAGTGPCDIYASGGTPCVAAHSTVRALYGAYNGRLYQVRRASNGVLADINTLSAGGFANAAAQDSFCAGTTCTISTIYDQSGRGNHLTRAPMGGWLQQPAIEANATAARITVGGNTVYGVYTTGSFDSSVGGVGYRNNNTSGIATGDQPEGVYMVASGRHYNEWCCFDYGNADPSNLAAGEGTMEAVYFGDSTQWGHGSGSGPWVMADLEFGLFAGGALVDNNNTPIIADYVTGMVKGNSGNLYAIKGGNAQSGSLKTMYNGPRPSGYNPMRKGGAIVLGVGGDNSHTGEGTFFEGAMTSGYPSDATENAVQANIVAAGYGSGSGSSGGPAGYTWCANENGTCTFSGTASVAYGANGAFNYRTATNSIACNNATFGDPLSGVVKACYYQTTGGTFPVPGTYYRIVNRNSGKVVDVSGVSTADGANVHQWAWVGGANQQWQFVATDSGYYRIVARHSGKVLDVSGVSTTDGANVHQWTWLGGANQQWSLTDLGGGSYRLTARHSGKVLEVSGFSTADGGNIQQWSWTGTTSQQWQIVP
jgi:hypothetical protein